MSERMPITPEEVSAALNTGRAAVQYAQQTRADQRRHRRPDRVEQLGGALAGLHDAMNLIRPFVHASTRRPVPQEMELREVSQAIQAERRKLRKMLNATLNRQPVIGLDGGWS